MRTLELTNKLISDSAVISETQDDSFRLKAIRIYLMEFRKTHHDIDVSSENLDSLQENISNYLRLNTTLPNKYMEKSEIIRILNKVVG